MTELSTNGHLIAQVAFPKVKYVHGGSVLKNSYENEICKPAHGVTDAIFNLMETDSLTEFLTNRSNWLCKHMHKPVSGKLNVSL